MSHCVESIEGLKNLVVPADTPCRALVQVLGYVKPGDGGGGLFFWDKNTTADDNLGTIIRSNVPSMNLIGRWRRLYDAPVSVRWFGVGVETVDSTTMQQRIQAAIDVVCESSTSLSGAAIRGGDVFIPSGRYTIEDFTLEPSEVLVADALLAEDLTVDVVGLLEADLVLSDVTLLIQGSTLGVSQLQADGALVFPGGVILHDNAELPTNWFPGAGSKDVEGNTSLFKQKGTYLSMDTKLPAMVPLPNTLPISCGSTLAKGTMLAKGTVLPRGSVLRAGTKNVFSSGSVKLYGTILVKSGVRLRGEASRLQVVSNPMQDNWPFQESGATVNYTGVGYAIVVGDAVVNRVTQGYWLEDLNVTNDKFTSSSGGIRVGALLRDANNTCVQVTIRGVSVGGFRNEHAKHFRATYSSANGVTGNEKVGWQFPDYGYPDDPTGACAIFLQCGQFGVIDQCFLQKNHVGLFEAGYGRVTTFQISNCYFSYNDTFGVRLTDSVAIGFYKCAFETNGNQALLGDTKLGMSWPPTSQSLHLSSLFMRDCYFEDDHHDFHNAVSEDDHYACDLRGDVDRATLDGFRVGMKPASTAIPGSKGAVRIVGGAGCVVTNIHASRLADDDAAKVGGGIFSVSTQKSQGANYVFGLRGKSDHLENCEYKLDMLTVLAEFAKREDPAPVFEDKSVGEQAAVVRSRLPQKSPMPNPAHTGGIHHELDWANDKIWIVLTSSNGDQESKSIALQEKSDDGVGG